MKAGPANLHLMVLFGLIPASLCAQADAKTSQSASNAIPYRTDVSLRPPAVSGVNGKLDYAGGDMNSYEGHNFGGSISVPIAQQFGFQADALYSSIDCEDFYGGAGHLFWRNPDFGLIGVSGGYLAADGVETFQVGAEGEYYLGHFTFGIFAGVGSIEYDNSAPFIDTSPTCFIGRVSADWYALEVLRLGVTYTTAFDNNLFRGDVEYQTPIRGLALTAEVAMGNYDYDHWLLGVRYYFGGNKSLRDRQRQDDPRSLMPQILYGLGLYGAEFNDKGKSYVSANPGTGGSGTGGHYGVVTIDVIDISGTDVVFPPFPPGDLIPPGSGGVPPLPTDSFGQ